MSLPRGPWAFTFCSFAALALAGCAEAGSTAAGQALSLGEPTAVFPEDFGSIQTVREVPDGRLLVADPLGRALYLVDMDAGTRTVVGAEGAGPNEYLQPDAVWPLPGDSTLLVDLGNGRLVALGPDLQFGPTMPLVQGTPNPGTGLVMALPQGVDGEGRVYAPMRTGGFSAEPPDSGAILRIERQTGQVDTVGSFQLRGQIRTTAGRGVTIRPIPLSPEDAWGVAPDGSIVVARAGAYRVDWLAPDGTETAGPSIALDPLPLGAAEQDEYFAEQERNVGLMISVTRGGGTMETSIQRGAGGGGRGGAPDPDVYEWPETLPAVHSGRIPVDPSSRAWVRRYVAAGGPATYDVFGRDGSRLTTIELPGVRRVVGFGADAVYVVAFDEFNLNYLERYAMPAL